MKKVKSFFSNMRGLYDKMTDVSKFKGLFPLMLVEGPSTSQEVVALNYENGELIDSKFLKSKLIRLKRELPLYYYNRVKTFSGEVIGIFVAKENFKVLSVEEKDKANLSIEAQLARALELGFDVVNYWK